MTVILCVVYLVGVVAAMRASIGPIMREMGMDRDDPVDCAFGVMFAGLAALLWPIALPIALAGLWALGPKERADR